MSFGSELFFIYGDGGKNVSHAVRISVALFPGLWSIVMAPCCKSFKNNLLQGFFWWPWVAIKSPAALVVGLSGVVPQILVALGFVRPRCTVFTPVLASTWQVL